MDGCLRRKPKSSESFREEKKNFYHFPLEPCFKFLITKEGKREEEEMCFGELLGILFRIRDLNWDQDRRSLIINFELTAKVKGESLILSEF